MVIRPPATKSLVTVTALAFASFLSIFFHFHIQQV
jgi:hypothetical protein